MNSRIAFLLLSGVVLAVGCNRTPPSSGSDAPAAKPGNERSKEPPGIPGEPSKGTASESDLEKLQGVWVWRGTERAGEEHNSAFERALSSGQVLTFKGDKLQIQMAVPGTNRIATVPATFRLDPTTTPMSIDYTLNNPDAPAHGKTTKGVYGLNGDTLRLAWALDDKEDRPKVLVSKAGDDRRVLIYVRKKGGDTGQEGSSPSPAPIPNTAGAGNQPEVKPKHGVLGDSPVRLAECYGKAVTVSDHTDLKDTKVYTFKTERLTIKAAVAGGKCGDIQYTANEGTKLAPEVVEELLRANTPPGLSWQKLEVGDTVNNPKWMCEGKGKDGTEISRFAQRPREELFVVDLLFKQKHKK